MEEKIVPISIFGEEIPQRRSGSNHSFSLYGKDYRNKTLKEMIITVFSEVMKKHPDKIDQVVANINCVERGYNIFKREQTNIFNQGEVVDICGTPVSIGTTQGQMTTRTYFRKLISITGESDSILSIDGMGFGDWYNYVGNGGL